MPSYLYGCFIGYHVFNCKKLQTRIDLIANIHGVVPFYIISDTDFNSNSKNVQMRMLDVHNLRAKNGDKMNKLICFCSLILGDHSQPWPLPLLTPPTPGWRITSTQRALVVHGTAGAEYTWLFISGLSDHGQALVWIMVWLSNCDSSKVVPKTTQFADRTKCLR